MFKNNNNVICMLLKILHDVASQKYVYSKVLKNVCYKNMSQNIFGKKLLDKSYIMAYF